MEKNYITINASLTHQGKTVNPNISFLQNGHTVHHNFQHIILELNLNATGITFLSYICESMDVNNLIQLDVAFKTEYIAFSKKISGKGPTSRKLSDIINQFKEKHLIIQRLDWPLLYIVNPKYFSNGSKEKRKKLLLGLLSAEYDGKINKEALLDRPIESFFIVK